MSGLPVLASVALGIVKLSIGSVAMISASGQPEKTAFGGSVTEKNYNVLDLKLSLFPSSNFSRVRIDTERGS